MIFGNEMGGGFVAIDDGDNNFVWIFAGTKAEVMSGKCCFTYGGGGIDVHEGAFGDEGQMEDSFLIYVEFRKVGNCFVEIFFRGWNFFETEIVEGGFEIEFVGGIVFGNVGFDCSFQEMADWLVGLLCWWLDRGARSLGCTDGGLLMHFGFNWGNSDNTVSKDIELLLEGGVIMWLNS